MLMASVIDRRNGQRHRTPPSACKSGHIQVRAPTYDENKASLKWEDLVENPDQIAGQIAALEPGQSRHAAFVRQRLPLHRQ